MLVTQKSSRQTRNEKCSLVAEVATASNQFTELRKSEGLVKACCHIVCDLLTCLYFPGFHLFSYDRRLSRLTKTREGEGVEAHRRRRSIPMEKSKYRVYDATVNGR